MFSSTGFSKANAYRQVGVHSGVEDASPHMLIQMLFDGLFQSLNAARGAIERGDIEEKGQLISRSVRILQEGLIMGLDMEKGGELAANLRLLYDYCVAQLTKANLRSDASLVEEVIGVLQPVAQGWKEIGSQVDTVARGD
ncbi:flagellar export chaperone FliS [Comamonas sp. CMM03]|uniref:flagellar export chaperone FliS n=1 Tax=Comamonas sp. CMM03 TaxID=2854781 RepID=UPI001C44DAB5|nr:flagellar export chaperone FliS [Comamonas sp. CMM03]MBV7419538.1 flagellar export chaperone FliS [Comamonas sp. CMM03]